MKTESQPPKSRPKHMRFLVLILVLALIAAALFLIWNTPFFGRALSTSRAPASGSASSDTTPSSDLTDSTDADIQAQLAAEHPELANRADSEGVSGSNPAGSCSNLGSLSALILGIDNMEQADSIRLTRLDFANEQISLLAIPRDFWVPVVGMQEHGITHGRINATYGYGEFYNGAGGGIVSLAANIDHNFGIQVDHYFILHFDDISRYIDRIGGVDIVLDEPVDDGESFFDAGKHHLDGETAVVFMRMRLGDSDVFRVRRQSLVLTAFYKKVISQLSFWQLIKLGVTVLTDQSISTDFAIKDVYSLACLANRIDREDVTFYEIPKAMYSGITTNKGASVIVPGPQVPGFIQSVMSGTYPTE